MEKFNLREWKAKLAAMSDDELRQTFRHHLNYVPNSPIVRPAMIELERRGI